VTLRLKLMLQVGLALLLALGIEIVTVILLQRGTFSAILSEIGVDVPWAMRAMSRLELAEILYAGLNAALIFGFWVWMLERSLVRPLQRLEATREREQRHQLEEKDEQLNRAEQLALIGRLGTGLAHEIGNPLGAVMGYVSLLRDETQPEAKKDLVDRAEAELQRIHGLIRELLDYARPSTLKRERLQAHALVEGARNLLVHQPRGRDVTFENDVAETMFVFGDTQRLMQVLLNIFLNAADAMGGTGAIRVFSRGNDLHIEDSGPGFSEDALLHAGEPFFTTKAAGSGTGLGLAVSKTLVRELGGRLRFENGSVGARVVLTLQAA